LLFFSLAESKLATYVLPMFPPLALLVARLWIELMSHPATGLRRAAAWSFAPVSIVPIAVLYQSLDNPSPDFLTRYGLELHTLGSSLGVLVLGLTIAAVCLGAKRARLAFTAVVLSVAAFLGLFTEYVVPGMTEHETSKSLVLVMDDLVPEGETLKFVDRLRDSALFYTDRKVEILHGPVGAAAYLASTDRVYCLMEGDEFERAEPGGFVIARAGTDVLVSNRAGPWPKAGHGPDGGSSTATRADVTRARHLEAASLRRKPTWRHRAW
jgi:hypothetical protein